MAISMVLDSKSGWRPGLPNRGLPGRAWLAETQSFHRASRSILRLTYVGEAGSGAHTLMWRKSGKLDL